VLGQLVARIRAQGNAERQREERATALYELMRNLASASSRDELVWHLIAQVNRVFSVPAAVCLPAGSALAAHPDSTLALSEKELSVAQWAQERRQATGRFTDNLPGAGALHLPLATDRKTFGVLSVNLPGTHLGLAQRELLETFASQAALVLERVELRAVAARASLVAESERLGRALLNSISHELRTPLAASTSAVSSLLETDSPELRRILLGELQEANARLNRIVGNLLDVARLEAGNVRPRLDWHDARDLVQTTVRDLQRELAGHPLTVDLPAEPVLARVDFSLLQHALANLLLNAASHTPPGTEITVRVKTDQDGLVLSVADRGAGVPAEVLPRIFDKFFRGPQAVAGGSGLGLTIARGFVEAHGGQISAANREGGGAVFIIQVPQPEKPPPSEAVA
jgi:two-component system sensor histidine kinase KdpD